MDFLDLARDRQWVDGLIGRKSVAKRGENCGPRSLLGLEVSSVTDPYHEMDERVVRVPVCYAVDVPAGYTRARTLLREDTRPDGGFVDHIDEALDVEPVSEVGGVFNK